MARNQRPSCQFLFIWLRRTEFVVPPEYLPRKQQLSEERVSSILKFVRENHQAGLECEEKEVADSMLL